MNMRIASKRVSSILLACLVASFALNLSGCTLPDLWKKTQPRLGRWIRNPQTNEIEGCGGAGNECAYVAIGCSNIQIPISLAEKLIEWQASAAQF